MDIETRAAQPYATVRATVTTETFAKIADRLPDVMQWLADHGPLAWCDPPAWRGPPARRPSHVRTAADHPRGSVTRHLYAS